MGSSSTTQLMQRALIVVASTLAVSCASGVTPLGVWNLPDGSSIHYVQIKNKGNSGPDVTVIEAMHCVPTGRGLRCHEQHRQAGAAPGLAEVAVGGVGPALIYGGAVVGAAAIWPSTKVIQNNSGTGGQVSGGSTSISATASRRSNISIVR